MLVAHYQARLKDVLGAQVAVFDTWRSLRYEHRLNDPGKYVFSMDAGDARRALFEADGEFEVWRSVPGAMGWYLEWAGLVEDSEAELAANGDYQFTSLGVKAVGLLGRRTVNWLPESAQAAKSGASETVMKAYVTQNAGPGATTAAGRLSDGVTPGLSVEGNLGRGLTWDGDRSERNLLETLQEIGNYSELGFDVVPIGTRLWEFRVYEDQPGLDRTTVGLDPATGLNSAGHVPVVFSPLLNNVEQATIRRTHSGEVNVAIVQGQGKGAARTIVVVEDLAAIGSSPLNRREASRGGGSQSSVAELENLGYEEVIRRQYREAVDFTPLAAEGCFYGVHYGFGDRVTYKDNLTGVEFHKRLVGVTATVEGMGETIQVEFADVL